MIYHKSQSWRKVNFGCMHLLKATVGYLGQFLGRSHFLGTGCCGSVNGDSSESAELYCRGFCVVLYIYGNHQQPLNLDF